MSCIKKVFKMLFKNCIGLNLKCYTSEICLFLLPKENSQNLPTYLLLLLL